MGAQPGTRINGIIEVLDFRDFGCFPCMHGRTDTGHHYDQKYCDTANDGYVAKDGVVRGVDHNDNSLTSYGSRTGRESRHRYRLRFNALH